MTPISRNDPLPAFNTGHDHGHCIDQALSRAQRLCKQQRARLTPVRQRVLELIWQSHRPLGAYQILEQLSRDGFNSAPPTVYRALEFLLEQGLAHRITSLNAFIGCSHPEHHHQGYFLICRDCGSTQELQQETLDVHLKQAAAAENFIIESQIVELGGLCPSCQAAPEEPHP
ncbi:MAG: Fur family zinc uptake transcriptional regulator [Motiliproteus sp.]|jgi:Fur family zinc uptake transcriptional regulator